jgi:hypothetical protein
MKKEKTVMVTVCDFCKEEKETRSCGGCGADVCAICSTHVAVHVTHWQESKSYMLMATVFTGQSTPDFAGVFCSQCSPASMFTKVGFTEKKKAA